MTIDINLLIDLHAKSTSATASFRAEAVRQGYRRTNIAFDGGERWFWLLKHDQDIALKMLKDNENPIDFCFDLTYANVAFFEYLPITAP